MMRIAGNIHHGQMAAISHFLWMTGPVTPHPRWVRATGPNPISRSVGWETALGEQGAHIRVTPAEHAIGRCPVGLVTG